jgi:catechol 2,3-dioxygenase-like lactoylglutathione lyase family enzyme
MYGGAVLGPMKLRPESVAVLVKDAKKARKWYTQKLGLKTIADGEHWITVGDPKGGIQLHLCEMSGRGGKPMLEPGNSGIWISTDGDMMRTYAAMKRKGVKFSQPPEQAEWGGWVSKFVDPDGNEFWMTPRE